MASDVPNWRVSTEAALLSASAIDPSIGGASNAALFKGCAFCLQNVCAHVLPDSTLTVFTAETEAPIISRGDSQFDWSWAHAGSRRKVSAFTGGGAEPLSRNRSRMVAELRRAPLPSGFLNAANDDTHTEVSCCLTAQRKVEPGPPDCSADP